MNWGILGTGRIARKFVQSLAGAPGEKVIAVASRDAGRAGEFARALGIIRVYGSYEELLKDPAVELIYVALPNSLHAPWSIAALQAGKHVLCEKPLATSVAEAELMFATARERGLRLMEAFMYRFHPQTLKVQELLAAGAIGAVRLVRTSFAFTVTDSGNTRLIAELAGGALMDVGCYCVNLARMVVGEAPVRASASAQWAESGVDDMLVGTLEYPGGALAQIACSLAASRHHHAQIVGTDGVIEIAEPFTPPFDRPTVVRVERGVNSHEVELIEVPPANHFQLEAMGFAASAARGKQALLPLEMPPAETIDNLATIEALLQSARNDQPTTISSRPSVLAPLSPRGGKPTRTCTACGGPVKDVVLIEDHGPAAGEKPAEVAPGRAHMSMGVAYNDRYPSEATACTRCGHVDIWVDSEWVSSLK